MKLWTVASLFILGFVKGTLGSCNTSSVTTFTRDGNAVKSVCSGSLIFEENFDSLNTSLWKHEVTLSGIGSKTFQFYTDDRSVSFTKNGILHIKPRLLADDKGEEFLYNGTIDLGKSCTTKDECKRTGKKRAILNPVLSARMRTRGTFSFRYGRVEVRMKCPEGNWLWPAMWLLPQRSLFGGWPRSGEIDIMESRGNLNLKYPFNAGSTLHWGPDRSHNMYKLTHYPKTDKSGFHAAFHKYQMEWTPDHISFSLDDVAYGKVAPPKGGFWELGKLDSSGLKNLWANGTSMTPFDDEFYFIINSAIGTISGYFPETRGKPWKNSADRFEAMTQFWEGRKQWLKSWKMDTDKSHFQVDYIKVWAL